MGRLLALAVAAVGAATLPAAASAAPAPAASAAAKPAPIEITVRSTRYGKVLADGRGRVFYLFTKERTERPRCYGACAEAWPVASTASTPKAGAGAKQSLVGTTVRKGGRVQATYAGHPLYYYVADRAPGQVTCQDVFEFGGTWLVLDRDGKAVR